MPRMASGHFERDIFHTICRQLFHHVHGDPKEIQATRQGQHTLLVQILRLEEAQNPARTKGKSVDLFVV